MKLPKRKKTVKPSIQETKVWITKSQLTSNYLIMIDDFCYDSASKKEDAQSVLKKLKELIKRFPIKNKDYVSWVHKYMKFLPETPDAEVFLINKDSGTMFLTQYNKVENQKHLDLFLGITSKGAI